MLFGHFSLGFEESPVFVADHFSQINVWGGVLIIWIFCFYSCIVVVAVVVLNIGLFWLGEKVPDLINGQIPIVVVRRGVVLEGVLSRQVNLIATVRGKTFPTHGWSTLWQSDSRWHIRPAKFKFIVIDIFTLIFFVIIISLKDCYSAAVVTSTSLSWFCMGLWMAL